MKKIMEVDDVQNKEALENVEEHLFKRIANHEQVLFCNDEATGLQAIIAIHDTTLGPALGGTRMQPYSSVSEALADVLRLSEGMTYKCAASGIDFGGGKAVIIGDPETDKSSALFRAFGQHVESLNGRFITGTDMGTTMDDFIEASKETNYINGVPEAYGGGGDTSIPTSQGVVYALEATNQFLYNHKQLEKTTYAVQGLGKVGFKVSEALLHRGAKLYVTDINQATINDLAELAKTTNGEVEVVDSDEIYSVDADVFIPCAMGGIINEQTIPQLKVKAIVGSANNQLKNEAQAEVLQAKGILFAPDYIVNSGGLIQVADELYGVNKERILIKTKEIYRTLLDIFNYTKESKLTTSEAANKKCQQTIDEQKQRNNFFRRGQAPKWSFDR